MCPLLLPQPACGSLINRVIFYSQFAIIWGRDMGWQLIPDNGKYLINTYTTGGLGQPNSNWLQLSHLFRWIYVALLTSPRGLFGGLEKTASTPTQCKDWKTGYGVYQRNFLPAPFLLQPWVPSNLSYLKHF